MLEKNKKINDLITVLTVNYNTSDFIELMLYALMQLTSNPYRVIICDNGSNKKDLIKLKRMTKLYNNISIILRKQTKAGSFGHGEALDYLVQLVETDYFVVMDADAIFLANDWDNILLSGLGVKIKCIGASQPENKARPSDFPYVYSTLFETKAFTMVSPTFLPDEVSIANGRDTGWNVREKYLQAGLGATVFLPVNTRSNYNTVFGRLLCMAYYYPDMETLISCHWGRGSSMGAAKYKNGLIYRIPIISRLVKRIKGAFDKNRWIKKCKRIVDEAASKGNNENIY